MFNDEARFGRINRPVRCWAPKGMRPTVGSQTIREYTYSYIAVSPLDGIADTLVLPDMAVDCNQLFVDEIGRRHPDELVILVGDGAGSHTTPKLTLPENVRLITLPPYSPQLNPVEQVNDITRERYFANECFDSLDAVKDRLVNALRDLESDPTTIRSLTKYPWIINAILSVT